MKTSKTTIKKISFLPLFLIGMVLTPASYGNLLLNSSFETGTGNDADNWTEFGDLGREEWADGDDTYADSGVDSPADYGMALYGWVGGGGGLFYQDTAAIVGTEYTLSGNMHFEPGFNPSSMEIKLEWMDAGLSQLSQDITNITVVTSADASNSANWNLYSVTGTAPTSTAFVRTTIAFAGTSDIGGNQAARVDNLVLVPEPSTFLMLGLGIFALIALRQRK